MKIFLLKRRHDGRRLLRLRLLLWQPAGNRGVMTRRREDDPNADLFGYVLKIDGGTGTVTGTVPWSKEYVSIWVIKRNIDYYCSACDLFADETISKDNCQACGGPLQQEEADADERMLGWSIVRSAALIRRHRELEILGQTAA